MAPKTGNIRKQSHCFPTPPKLKACVRRQITDPQTRQQFDKASSCFSDFTRFVAHRKRIHLVDDCQNYHPVLKPPAALFTYQRKRFTKISKKVLKLMETSGYQKGSWKWTELASIALFWVVVGDAYSYRFGKYSRAAKKVYQVHVRKHPILSRWFKELTKRFFSINFHAWNDRKSASLMRLAGGNWRRIISKAISSREGMCSEASNIYLRLWRQFAVEAKLNENKAKVAVMGYADSNGYRGTGHNYCAVFSPRGSEVIYLDPTFSINIYPQVPWLKESYRQSAVNRWISYAINSTLHRGRSKLLATYRKLFEKHNPLWFYFISAGYFMRQFHKGKGLNNPLSKAKTFFIKALKHDPHSSYSWSNLGLIYFFQGKMDRAVQSVNKALRSNGKNPVAWFHKGIILASQGKSEEAKRAIKQARNLRPRMQWEFILVDVAKKLAERGDRKRARLIIRYVLDNPPAFARKTAERVRALVMDGKRSQAEDFLRKRSAMTFEIKPGGIVTITYRTDIHSLFCSSLHSALSYARATSSSWKHTLSADLQWNPVPLGALFLNYDVSYALANLSRTQISLFGRAGLGASTEGSGIASLLAGIRFTFTGTWGVELSGGGFLEFNKGHMKPNPLARANLFYKKTLAKTRYGALNHKTLLHRLKLEVGAEYNGQNRGAFANSKVGIAPHFSIGYSLEF